MHLDIIKSFIYSPTDVLVNCLKKILKFTLKQLFYKNIKINIKIYIETDVVKKKY